MWMQWVVTDWTKWRYITDICVIDDLGIKYDSLVYHLLINKVSKSDGEIIVLICVYFYSMRITIFSLLKEGLKRY